MTTRLEATEATDATSATATRVLQRVVLPRDRDLDVLPLYVDSGAAAANPRAHADDEEGMVPLAGTESNNVQHPENILDRFRLRVPADTRVSFGTYFNAFAASYWRMWSILDAVTLRVRLTGSGTVVVYRSTSDGRSQRVASAGTEQVDGVDGLVTTSSESVAGDGGGEEFSFTLPLKPFGDGGWYWFDVTAGKGDAVVEEAYWAGEVPLERAEAGTATVGITVIRPDSCVPLLGQLAEDPDVMKVIDEVLVVDQGNSRVVDEPEFAAIDQAMGGKLRVLEQGNIGGSGGFARAQYETVTAGRSDYVLLLDDDIVAEPESILRAVTFADLASTPTVVGGHMFSLFSRSQLHSFGETINLWRFWWGPAERVRPEHDLARRNLRQTPWLHQRVDVDFNGWWMCLIPRVVLEDVGLGLPLFIKWDDAEFGVRAGAAGYPTVSMPGVAVWHVPWTDKNDALDWQAYFHQRNRTVSALLHSPYDRGGRMVRESFNHQIKHLLAMQYSVAELRIKALEDILQGPGHLHARLVEALPTVRAMQARHPDAQARPHPQEFPKVKAKPPRRGKTPTAPTGITGHVLAALTGTVRQALPLPATARRNPEARVPARDARWWRLAQLNSAVVSTTDGTAATWYRRDPLLFRQLLARSVAVHERLAQEWPRLARSYREALPDIASPQAWERTFAAARPADTAPAPADAIPVSGLVGDATVQAAAVPAPDHEDATKGPGG
jgi:galactofuranosylgalactofuranosylrhamnosyl-N-acetylglucosaminyl-diphospho-decaprenol beta-1,5/1,6-galactofuranosyltransferase